MSNVDSTQQPTSLEEALSEIDSLRSQLSGSDLKVFSQNRELRVENQKLKEEIRQLTEQCVSQTFKVRGLEKSEDKLQTQLSEAQSKISQLEDQVSELGGELEEFRSKEIHLSQELERTVAGNSEALERLLAEHSQEVEAKSAEFQAVLAEREQAIQELEQRVEQFKEEFLSQEMAIDTTAVASETGGTGAFELLSAKMEDFLGFPGRALVEQVFRLSGVDPETTSTSELEETFEVLQDTASQLVQDDDQERELTSILESAWAELGLGDVDGSAAVASHPVDSEEVEEVAVVADAEPETVQTEAADTETEIAQTDVAEAADTEPEIAQTDAAEAADTEPEIAQTDVAEAADTEPETPQTDSATEVAGTEPVVAETEPVTDLPDDGSESAEPESAAEVTEIESTPSELEQDTELSAEEPATAEADSTDEVAPDAGSADESAEAEDSSELTPDPDLIQPASTEQAGDDLPEVPDMPEVPEMPDIPEVPEIPELAIEQSDVTTDESAPLGEEEGSEPQETVPETTETTPEGAADELTREPEETPDSSQQVEADEPELVSESEEPELPATEQAGEETQHEQAGADIAESPHTEVEESENETEVSEDEETGLFPQAEMEVPQTEDEEPRSETEEASNEEVEVAKSEEEQVADFDTAATYLEEGRHADALPIFDQLQKSEPAEPTYKVGMLACLAGLSRFQEAYDLGKSLENVELGESHDVYQDSMEAILIGLAGQAESELVKKECLLELLLKAEPDDQIGLYLDEADEIPVRIPREGELSLLQATHRIAQDDVTEYLIDALHSLHNRPEIFSLLKTNLERYPELQPLSEFLARLLDSPRAEALEAESSVRDLLGQGETVEELLDETDPGEEAVVQVFLEHMVPRSGVECDIPSEQFEELLLDAEPAAFVGSLRQALRSVDYTVFFEEIEVLSYDGDEHFVLRSSPEPKPTLLFGEDLDDVPPEELRFLVLRELFSMYRRHSHLKHISAGLDDEKRVELVRACIEIFSEFESKVPENADEDLEALQSEAQSEGQSLEFRTKLEAFLRKVYLDTESDSFLELGDFLYNEQLNRKWLDSISDNFGAKQTGMVVASYAICRDLLEEEEFEELEESGFGWLYADENLEKYSEVRLRLQRLWSSPLKALISEPEE